MSRPLYRVQRTDGSHEPETDDLDIASLMLALHRSQDAGAHLVQRVTCEACDGRLHCPPFDADPPCAACKGQGARWERVP